MERDECSGVYILGQTTRGRRIWVNHMEVACQCSLSELMMPEERRAYEYKN